jgi:hypothetical protein
MLAAVAPSSGDGRSITTTDLMASRGTTGTDCTSSFGGTSAAAPLAGIHSPSLLIIYCFFKLF